MEGAGVTRHTDGGGGKITELKIKPKKRSQNRNKKENQSNNNNGNKKTTNVIIYPNQNDLLGNLTFFFLSVNI